MKKVPENIIIVPATEEHSKNFDCTMKDFYLDEPVFKAQKIDVEKLDRSFYEYNKGDFTLLAIDKINGAVASIARNKIINSNVVEWLNNKAETHFKENVNLYYVLRFWSSIQSDPCLFKMLNVDTMWEIEILATSKNYRNLGLSTALAKHSFEAALNNDNISIICMNCTNNISGKIAHNLGMECVVNKHFSEYTDDNGQPWIKNIPEQLNDTVKVFIYKKKNYEIKV